MNKNFSFSRRDFLKMAGIFSAGMSAFSLTSFGKEPEICFSREVFEDNTVAHTIAQALYDSNVKVLTNVPATKCSEIFHMYGEITKCGYPYSFHEELAYTIAFGAAVAGKRAGAVLKAHGFAKASNSILDSLTSGTTAGFLVIVTDDPEGTHSDNIFDIETFMKGTAIPFEKADPENIYNQIWEKLEYSEKWKIPVALYVSSETLSHKVKYCKRNEIPEKKTYRRSLFEHVVCPPLAGYQYKVLKAKLAEEDWMAIEKPPSLVIPDSLPERWQKIAKEYIPLFSVFKDVIRKEDFVAGDTGVCAFFAFPPYNAIDVCNHYGGSLPLAIGGYMAGMNNVWAVSGDYAFIAAGHMGLIEAVQRKIPLKVLLIKNDCAQTTGGQPIAGGILDRILSGYKEYVSVIKNTQDKKEVEKVLKEANNSDRMEIVIAEFEGS